MKSIKWLGVIGVGMATVEEEKELLMQIDWVSEKIAVRMLNHFGSGRKVAQSGCRYWDELTKVKGVSDKRAKAMFHEMKDAGVFNDLRGY